MQGARYFRQPIASLAIIGRGKRWLIDASPDLPEQVALLGPHGDQQMRDGRRPKIFDGIFLTHALYQAVRDKHPPAVGLAELALIPRFFVDRRDNQLDFFFKKVSDLWQPR